VESLGHYQLLGEIARGGMGVVYRASDAKGNLFAIKVLIDHDADSLQRFEREAHLAAGLEHANVVRVHDYGVARGKPYLVMEYVEGEDLESRLKRDGPLPETEARRLFASLGDGLRSAHALGIVHRDLKPQNVLLRGAEVFLTDFGLARAGPSTLTATGELLGTPAYMAPEQAAGSRDQIGPATDVYGFGATLYAALCGSAPCQGASLFEILDQVVNGETVPIRSRRSSELSTQLETLVMRCLARAPEDRPDLDSVLRELSRPTPRPTSLRRRAAVLMAGLMTLSLGGGLWVALAGGLGEDPTIASATPIPDTAPVSSMDSGTPPVSSMDSGTPPVSSMDSPCTSAARELVEQARNHLDQGQSALAAQLSIQARELDPSCAHALLARAAASYCLSEHTDTLSILEELPSLAPSPSLRAQALYLQARTKLAQLSDKPPSASETDLAGCAALLGLSLELHQTPAAHAWLGQVNLMRGDRPAAVESLEAAKALARDHPEVRYLGYILQVRPLSVEDPGGRISFEEALAQLRRAVVAGDQESADRFERRASTMRPNETRRLLATKGEALLQRATLPRRPPQAAAPDARRALELLERAIAQTQAQSRVHAHLLANRAGAHRALKNARQAREDLRASLEIAPGVLESQIGLCRLLQEQSLTLLRAWNLALLRKVLRESRGVLSEAKGHPLRLRTCQFALEGRLAAMECRFDEAESLLARAITLTNPKDLPSKVLRKQSTSIAVDLALFHLLRGRGRIDAEALGFSARSATSDFRLALVLRPGYPAARAWLAIALFSSGERARARRMAHDMRAELPTESPACLLVAMLVAKASETKAAVAGALKVEPGNPTLLGMFMMVEPKETLARIRQKPVAVREHPLTILALARFSRLRSARAEAMAEHEKILGRALELNPRCLRLAVELALNRAKQGRVSEGLRELERLVEQVPSPPIRAKIQIEITRLRESKQDRD